MSRIGAGVATMHPALPAADDLSHLSRRRFPDLGLAVHLTS
jgi:hypothetical protein